jgi:hypothetical protein
MIWFEIGNELNYHTRGGPLIVLYSYFKDKIARSLRKRRRDMYTGGGGVGVQIQPQL